ncbi:hypothetical protein BDV23DRAFT_173295 [Aspergillus alliaceus]|uniref:ADP-ribosylation factor family-domain-containing protein n=1 Tax=Petromyces alliaceus TaxID=209559 RepID=A0A5N7C4T7_PETAA|nr:hypothetical protein BDV23DRAFT_173295 [Aspergillus alliaceus]
MACLISSARTYVNQLWKSTESRVTLLGLDSAGKTTLLILDLVNRQIAETVHVPSEGVDLNFWDISGGCSRLSPGLLRHYQTSEVICLFVINKTDTERADEVVYELEYLKGIEAKYLAVVFNNFAYRQSDRVEVRSLVSRVIEVIERLRRLVDFPCEVYDDLDQFNAATGKSTDILLKRLARVAKTQTTKLEKGPVTKRIAEVENPPSLSREDLLERIREDSTDPTHKLSSDNFMRQLVTGELEKWDHQCHLRAGFLFLLECILTDNVVFAAADMFLECLDKMLKANTGKFRNTLHRTMTIFWLHQIYLQILSFREKNGALPHRDRFSEFLEQHPDLMRGRLWAEYYTKDVIFSPEAKEGWRLPDLQPLPQYISQMKTPRIAGNIAQSPKGNAEIYQRFAYTILRAVKSMKRRRAAIINESLPLIQSYIIHLRAQSPGLLEPYSETQAYFWIQMLHAAVESVPQTMSVDITGLSFNNFAILFPDLLASQDVWKEYYSPKQWDSMEARMQTVLPKRRPLPNIFPTPPQTQLDKTIASRLDEKYPMHDGPSVMDGRPGPEELFLRVQWAVNGTSATDLETNYNGSLDTHAALIRRMFIRIIVTGSTQSKTSISRALWDEISFLHERGQFTCAAFWSQMILTAFGGMDAAFHEQVSRVRDDERIGADGLQARLFSQFLSANSELTWEGLWSLYYSEEVWKSEDAGVVYILPDRRTVPAYIRG